MSVNLGRRALLRGKVDAQSPQRQPVPRMPWLDAAKSFTDLCHRCEHCIAACETGVLVKGDGGFPEVDFSQGECSFCSACVSVCNADLFDLHQDAPWRVRATIGPSCLNVHDIYCRSCAEHCDYEAMSFKPVTSIFVAPRVDMNACSGCGACVAGCPAGAITIDKIIDDTQPT